VTASRSDESPAPGRADQSDLLTARHGVANLDEWFAEVEITGDNAPSVIDVNHGAG
jgi:hypothetical protein